MPDKYLGSRFGTTAREWTPTDIDTAARAFVRHRYLEVTPSALDSARAFQRWCEDHPHHGYDPETGYDAAIHAAGYLRVLWVPTDELDDVPERWLP
jgi:hypothetical protein